ncbi:UdgX family uracil-DNA binding protein [Henriciella pelagia]|uniref:Type-4 uracil-DNA glycosylase n=1 Tax=Henriciella pelagia TaxID=1977912 RepID=A0ABQ1JFL8_9PROT|nr:UdgX family uracil-DNA binding protein [Henriciella pelagia]GGB67734.1 uracil-DNA glycosylase [Henriciella pelagia]
MIEVELQSETDFEGWRVAARKLCAAQIRPAQISWRLPGQAGSLFGGDSRLDQLEPVREVRATKPFLDLARKIVCYRDEQRFDRLYSALFKLQSAPHILSHRLDADTDWLMSAQKAIRRDIHKMHAFVRFRKAGESVDGREHYAAWFEPTHRITTLGAPFFRRRFPNMNWVIVTPEASAMWDGSDLTYGPGGRREDVPSDDSVEDQWKTYFQAIFNPARLKVSAMTSEMPKKYWKNMPEAALIPDMIASAQARTRQMQDEAVTAPTLLSSRLAERHQAQRQGPETPQTLEEARKAILHCTRCSLHCHASQPVFGEGPARARIMIVGEQPGDQEDIAGKPFVGPAGKVLDGALEQAGIERSAVYVTNAVKHFKFTPRGKRRMHAKPNAGEIDHCRWWLDLERAQVDPAVTVALGATALRGVLGKSVKVGDVRGTVIDLGNRGQLVPTIHPSYLLRLPDKGLRAEQEAMFIDDLARAARLAA